MKKTYLAPKNDITESIDKTKLNNFVGYIDSNKKGYDIININNINKDDINLIIIYSPNYYEEIYTEFIKYVPKNKIKFYLFENLYTSSIFLTSLYYKLYTSYLLLQKRIKKNFQKSETSKVRSSLGKYCIGNGIDIGFGGDPILPSAISIDLSEPYAKYKNNHLNLKGSGDNLYWFKDNVLDYVYSSHLLEDFTDTKAVINEWLRVIKPNGNLVLFLPDEQIYRQYCKTKGLKPNHNHIHDNFSFDFVMDFLKDRDDIKILHKLVPSNIYSFELVIQKTK